MTDDPGLDRWSLARRLPLTVVAVTVAIAATVTTLPRPSPACVRVRSPDVVFPYTPAAAYRAARVPENAPGFAWFVPPCGSQTDFTYPRLLDSTGAVVPLTAETWNGGTVFRLQERWSAGSRFRIPPRSMYESLAQDIEVTSAAPWPNSLGTIEVGEPLARNVRTIEVSGSCTCPARAVARMVALRRSAEMEPWADAAVYTIEVDGQPTHGDESWLSYQRYCLPTGRTHDGTDRVGVYLRCGSEPVGLDCDAGRPDGSAAATRTVRIVALLPGLDRVLATESVTVDLRCSTVASIDSARGGCAAAARDQPTGGRPWTAVFTMVAFVGLFRFLRARRSR